MDVAAKLAQTLLRIRAQSSVPPHEPDPADVEISPLTAEIADTSTFPALLAALIGARVQQVYLGEITAAWRRRAEVNGPAVVAVAERFLESASLPQDLEHLLTDGRESYEQRFVAAALICGLGDTGPSGALHTHIIAFEALAHSGLLREFASSSVAAIVRRDWLRLTGEPALLRYPRLYVDDIRSACDAPSTPQGDWPATARILLSALPAVNLGSHPNSRSASGGRQWTCTGPWPHRLER
jgi:hypothetical protein